MLTIDGSQKSGSGTIVRDAVPFCALTGKSLRLFNIRSQRKKPGLRTQHLTAIRACAQLCQGELRGDEVGASEIIFTPGKKIIGGNYRWDIGTAGSTIMLAMAVLPMALFADAPSRFTITGGLFQDFAPSAFHFQQLFLTLLQRMGADVEITIIRPGYVPAGQGEIELRVTPLTTPLQPIVLEEPGPVEKIEGIALSSHLRQRNVSHRMGEACEKELRREGYSADIRIVYDETDQPAFRKPAAQPGAVLAVRAQTGNGALIGADMAGAIRRSAEFIGKQVARNLLADLHSGATVDRYLADQLIPYTALAAGVNRYRIPRMTDHVAARLWLVEKILGARVSVQNNTVEIQGIGFRSS